MEKRVLCRVRGLGWFLGSVNFTEGAVEVIKGEKLLEAEEVYRATAVPFAFFLFVKASILLLFSSVVFRAAGEGSAFFIYLFYWLALSLAVWVDSMRVIYGFFVLIPRKGAPCAVIPLSGDVSEELEARSRSTLGLMTFYSYLHGRQRDGE